MADLAALAADYWEFRLTTELNLSIQRGTMDYPDRVEDLSLDALAHRSARYQEFIAAAEAIDPATLDLDDRITRSALIATSEARLAQMRSGTFTNPSHTVGLHGTLFNSLPQLPISTIDQAEARVDRYHALAGMMDGLAERLSAEAQQGRAGSASTIAKVATQLDDYLASPLDGDRLLDLRAPEDFDAAAEESWRQRIRDAVEESIRPAFGRYADALRTHVVPKARPDDKPGLCWLDGGDAEYDALVRSFTTLDVTAEEVHEIGLETVAGLDDEYREIGSNAFGLGTVDEVFERLTTDPSLRHDSAEALVAHAEEATARATAAAPDAFTRIPKAACEVVATEIGPLAFYKPPAEDGSRPGTYFINAEDPSAWGTYQIEATSFHEAVPGHHFQVAIAKELTGLPVFRINTYIGAYGEGWALYTERLADEMGLYSSEVDRLGMLAADSMRATRLVVDTGMHAKGWTRSHAIDYMAANAPMSRDLVANEIDRYIAMAGQALSYMMGRREIVRLRQYATVELADKFDLGEFHDRLLRYGMVPLGALGEIMEDWIASAA